MSKFKEMIKRAAQGFPYSSTERELLAELERLTPENEALKGLYQMHKATETREMIGLRGQVDDLSALVRRLVHSLSKAAPEHDLPAKALDYLKRKGLQGSPLRGSEASE